MVDRLKDVQKYKEEEKYEQLHFLKVWFEIFVCGAILGTTAESESVII